MNAARYCCEIRNYSTCFQIVDALEMFVIRQLPVGYPIIDSCCLVAVVSVDVLCAVIGSLDVICAVIGSLDLICAIIGSLLDHVVLALQMWLLCAG